MVHWEAPFLAIHWNEEVQCVLMEWKKWAQGEDFRVGLDKGLKLLVEKKTGKWLADLRDLGVVTEEDQNWSNENWFPRALASGVKFMAIVIPRKAIARMSVDSIMSKVPGTDLVTHYFDEVDEAINWIMTQ